MATQKTEAIARQLQLGKYLHGETLAVRLNDAGKVVQVSSQFDGEETTLTDSQYAKRTYFVMGSPDWEGGHVMSSRIEWDECAPLFFRDYLEGHLIRRSADGEFYGKVLDVDMVQEYLDEELPEYRFFYVCGARQGISIGEVLGVAIAHFWAVPYFVVVNGHVVAIEDYEGPIVDLGGAKIGYLAKGGLQDWPQRSNPVSHSHGDPQTASSSAGRG